MDKDLRDQFLNDDKEPTRAERLFADFISTHNSDDLPQVVGYIHHLTESFPEFEDSLYLQIFISQVGLEFITHAENALVETQRIIRRFQ